MIQSAKEILINMHTYAEHIGDLRADMDEAVTYFDKLRALKRFYLNNQEKILKHHNRWAFQYPIDWNTLLNPIEMEAWQCIRSHGLIVMYPQYPVSKYFIDFANPVLKIGIEIDGKDFHDLEKDMIRDQELKEIGWTIYRITGKEMYRTDARYWDSLEDETIPHWEIDNINTYHFMQTGEGVIQAIRHKYFLQGVINDDHNNLCEKTLAAHTIV